MAQPNISDLSNMAGDLRVLFGQTEDELLAARERASKAVGSDSATINRANMEVARLEGELDSYQSQLDACNQRIERAGGAVNGFGGQPNVLASSRWAGPRGSGDQVPSHLGGQQPSGKPALWFRDMGSGAKLRALEPHERLCQDPPAVSIGDFLVGKLRGNDWSGLDAAGQEFAAKIAQSESSITGGGAMVVPVLSSLFLDLAREQSRVVQAGARTVQMDAAQLVVGRLTADVTPVWSGEGEAVTSSQTSYGSITITPRKLVTLSFATREWLADCPNAGDLVQRSHMGAAGAKLDYAALYGYSSGGSEPRGLKNASGINSIASVGTPANFNHPSQAVREIMDANYAGEVSSLAWLLSPREGQTYNDLTDTTGQPLQAPEWVRQLRRHYASAIDVDEGVGEDEATSFIGDFSEMVFFMRQPLSFEFLASGTALDADGNSENALSEDKLAIRSTMRVDVVTLRPSFFTKLTGITAS